MSVTDRIRRWWGMGVILIALLVSSCTAAPTTGVQTSSSGASVGAQESAPVSEQSPNDSERLLYFEYEGYELEGVPPHPSPFVELQSRYRTWIDMQNPARMRTERLVTEAGETEVQVASYQVGNAEDGQRDCQLNGDEATCTDAATSAPSSYDEWLAAFTAGGHRMLENKDDPEAIGGYVYKGTEASERWGEVHVFERTTTLQASDRFPGVSVTETLKVDTDLLRRVEETRIVDDGGTPVLYQSYTLVRWEELPVASAPATLFDLDTPAPLQD